MKIQWMQIYHMISTLLLLLWKLAAAFQHDYEEVLYASACFHQVKKSLTLSCPRGHMVKLNRIFYAYTDQENTCSYLPGHCTMDLPESESYSCIGRSSCTINLPSGDIGKFIPKCNNYGTYAQAEYQCIPETKTTDICSNDTGVLISQRGFISTPNYPYNYPNSLDCILKVKAPHSDQKMTLYTIDLILEQNRTGCADWLHLFDGHRAATYCAARARVKDFTTLENWLELNFHSSNTNRRKGFWLYFEATPYRELTSSAEQQSSPMQWSYVTTVSDVNNIKSDTNQTASTVSNPKPGNTEKDPITPYNGNALTVGAIVGVAVSLLLLITVIILVILVCKRKDTSNHTVKVPSSVSCNSEVAFLNFGPNCYTQNPNLSASPSYLDYNQGINNQTQGSINNQPQGSINQDCEATVIKHMADDFNVTRISDYNKLDADYYKKNGRYLEEVI